jgi:hypothetical protein
MVLTWNGKKNEKNPTIRKFSTKKKKQEEEEEEERSKFKPYQQDEHEWVGRP